MHLRSNLRMCAPDSSIDGVYCRQDTSVLQSTSLALTFRLGTCRAVALICHKLQGAGGFVCNSPG